MISGAKARILERFKREKAQLFLSSCLDNCAQCSFTARAIGFGDLMSPIVLVGQSLHAPCSFTPTQIPFIGPMKPDSGDTLFNGIEQGGLRPEDLYITNVVKCHPPGNKPNKTEWEQACFPFLVKELGIVRPTYVIALGSQAYSAILRNTRSLNPHHIDDQHEASCRCLVAIQNYWFILIKVSHPSYAMRCGRLEEEKWILEFGKLLKGLKGSLK